MSLTKKDLENIGNIVDEKIGTAIDTKVPVIVGKMIEKIVPGIVEQKVTTEIGLLRLEMNQRFDQVDKKIDDVEERLTTKIEEVKQMETEDIQVLYADVARIKKKMAV